MIHNFYLWLKTQLPTLTFTKHNFKKNSNSTCILVRQYDGVPGPEYYDRKDFYLQIISRSKEDHEAFTNAVTVNNLLMHQFMIVLPAVTVDSVNYPSIVASKISTNQLPGGIGSDKEMRYMYVFNITIVTK